MRTATTCFVAALGILIVASEVRAPRPRPARPVSTMGLPLVFEPADGDRAGFVGRSRTGAIRLSPDDPVMDFRAGDPAHGVGIRMRPVGGRPSTARAEEPLPGRSSYFLGNDPAKWRRGVPQFGAVRYREVYPGVDLVFHGNQRRLEYDAVVAAGADPSRVELQFDGIDSLSLDHDGGLLLHTAAGDLKEMPPTVYQLAASGEREPISGRYVIKGANRIGFELGAWDRSRSVVIDPTLLYGTYLGGTGYDTFSGIGLDPVGNIYVAGYTNSADFPSGPGFRTTAPGGGGDFVVAKLNTAGTALLYSTYVGGSAFDSVNYGKSIAIDTAGNAYVVGQSNSTDFPVVNAFQSSKGAGTTTDAVVFKVATTGTALLYSTYLGGGSTDVANTVTVDSIGRAYVAGVTAAGDFPVKNPIQTWHGNVTNEPEDSFVAVLGTSGNSLVYSTYFGGTGNDEAYGIALDPSGNVYVTGFTNSSDLAMVNAFQPTSGGGGSDGFVFKINAAGTALVYSTYLGGSSNELFRAIAVDTAGEAFVTGLTDSSDFPTKNPFQGYVGGSMPANNDDAFIAKLSASGNSLAYSSFLGGNGYVEQGVGIAVDAIGAAYVAGGTSSTNFPTVNAVQPTHGGGFMDGFVAKVNPAGSGLVYSTYLGGSGSDVLATIALRSQSGFGVAYIAGQTDSTNFPVLSPLQGANAGSNDGVIAIIHDSNAPIANSQSVVTNEQTPINITLTASDPNSLPLTWTITSFPTHGTLTGTAPNVTYSPGLNYNGPDSFQFQVNNGALSSNVATVSITVRHNQPPLPVDDYVLAQVNTPLVISGATLLANDVDPGPLTIMSVQQPTHGTTSPSGGNVTYTPSANYVGSDTFSYIVQNLAGLSGIASVHVTVAGVVAVQDFVSTQADVALPIPAGQLLANDIDADGDVLSISSVSGAVNGSVSLAGSTVTFTPSLHFAGLGSFNYTVTDGTHSATGSVTVTVYPGNGAPTAADDSITTNENTPVTVAAATLLANDTDPNGDALTLEAVGQGAYGSVSLAGSNVTYTPNANFHGSDRFTYVVRDPQGLVGIGNVNVTVAHVNQVPVANADYVSTLEDAPREIPVAQLLGNDTDVDGDTLTVTSVSGPTNGSVLLSGGIVTFTPSLHLTGTGGFSYTISDGALTATAQVTVAIFPVDYAPVAVDDAITTNENAPITVAASTLLANDSDPNGDTLSLDTVGQGAHGSVTVNGSNVTYAPDANFSGADRFTYTVRDPQGLIGMANVNVTVTHVNQAPVANLDFVSTLEDAPLAIPAAQLLANDTDVDGDALTVVSVSAPANGTVALSGSTVTFTPSLHFRGSGSFSYTISDGALTASAVATVSVLPVNHAPGAPGISAPLSGGSVTSLTPALVATDATDIDGDPLSLEFEVDSRATFDSAELQASGPVAQGSNGTVAWAVPSPLIEDSVWFWRVRALDAADASDWTIGSFFVDTTNEPPTAPIALSPVENELLEGRTPTLVIANATDPDGDPVTYEFEVHETSLSGPVVVSSAGIASGTDGRTELALTTPLHTARTYVWRARATDSNGATGPYSDPAEFNVYRPSHGRCDVEGEAPATATPFLLLGLAGIVVAVRRTSRDPDLI